MRMWMVLPDMMCNQHLLGEHKELHLLKGLIDKQRKLTGWIHKRLIEPSSVRKRHEDIVKELLLRGMKHGTPLDMIWNNVEYLGQTYHVKVDKIQSMKELMERCADCRDKYNQFTGQLWGKQ